MPYIAKPRVLGPGAAAVRNSLGGHPFLPADTAWPLCPKGGEPMVLFFQLDIRPEFGLKLAAGSHLAVFMSPQVNEIPSFDSVGDGERLPDRFWEKRLDHFKVFIFPPSQVLVSHPQGDARLVHQELEFEPIDKPSDPFLFLGGKPRWYQDPEQPEGYEFICQLSENFPFPKQEAAAKQPDSFSRKDYCLFLGNSTYFFARAKPSHPEEVWIVVQN